MHTAAKAQLHQPGQEAAVVDVRMRQHHCIDVGRGQGQGLPVAQPQLLDALEQPAVDQQLAALVLEQVFRPGDSIGGAKELQSHVGTIMCGRQRPPS